MKHHEPNSTVSAKRVPVQLNGVGPTREMWVKPWTAAPGARVDYRSPGSDWPWHRGVLTGKQKLVYVIEAA